MKPFMKILIPAAGLAVLGTLADCSSLSTLPQGPQGYKVVAGSRSSAPSWINSIGEYTRKQNEKKGNRGSVWFTASSPLETRFRDPSTMPMSERCARRRNGSPTRPGTSSETRCHVV